MDGRGFAAVLLPSALVPPAASAAVAVSAASSSPPPAAGPCDPSGVVAVEEVRAVMASAGRLGDAVPASGRWSTPERRGVLAGLDQVIDALTAVRAVVLVAERESGAWAGGGDRSFDAWRSRTSRAGQRSAAAQVRQAEHLAAVPAVAAAVTEGRITLEQATAIGKVAATGTPAQQAAAQSPGAQAELVDLAGRVDGGTFATSVSRWAATVDPGGLERDHQAQRRERYLHVVDTPRGTFIKGQVDAMAGHRFTLALEALTPRPAADDDRDRGQRAADALDAMATTILGLVDTKPGGHVPPQISLLLSAGTWAAGRAERDRRRARTPGRAPAAGAGDLAGVASGRPAAVEATGVRATAGDGATGDVPAGLVLADATPDDGLGYPPATLEDGAPVPVSELAAAMCDCEITRIVLDADGAPLDLGRTERVFTGPQRRAVIARDRRCGWPDCAMNARWCQIHHIQWWERDSGPTSVDNGVLLCSYHHHEVHRRDLTITRITSPPLVARARAAARSASPATPGGPPGDEFPRARYRFRDRAGQVTGDQPRTHRRSGMVARDAAHREAVEQNAARPEAVEQNAARQEVNAGPVPPGDVLDLGWVDDPVTGRRVPAFLTAP